MDAEAPPPSPSLSSFAEWTLSEEVLLHDAANSADAAFIEGQGAASASADAPIVPAANIGAAILDANPAATPVADAAAAQLPDQVAAAHVANVAALHAAAPPITSEGTTTIISPAENILHPGSADTPPASLTQPAANTTATPIANTTATPGVNIIHPTPDNSQDTVQTHTTLIPPGAINAAGMRTRSRSRSHTPAPQSPTSLPVPDPEARAQSSDSSTGGTKSPRPAKRGLDGEGSRSKRQWQV
jgi:hypothetical protein